MEEKSRKRAKKQKVLSDSGNSERNRKPKREKESLADEKIRPNFGAKRSQNAAKQKRETISRNISERKGPVSGKPSLIQSTYGIKGNFEIVVPRPEGGLAHYWRNNDLEKLPWQGPETFGLEAGYFDGVSLIQSNFGEMGNLELVASDIGGHSLMHFWKESGPEFGWKGPVYINTKSLIPEFSGSPTMVRSTLGTRGNFEVVIPRAEGGFSHYWRDNDHQQLPWIGPNDFAVDCGIYDAVSMIQSNFGQPGNLEMVARSNDQLFFFWRDSGPDFTWHGPLAIASGVEGNPSLIQSTFGTKGNFELSVPLTSGALASYQRDNDDPELSWNGPFMFGMTLGKVDAVSLIQSNFGHPGHLELVSQTGGQLAFFWRDSGPDFRWNGPQFITL